MFNLAYLCEAFTTMQVRHTVWLVTFEVLGFARVGIGVCQCFSEI